MSAVCERVYFREFRQGEIHENKDVRENAGTAMSAPRERVIRAGRFRSTDRLLTRGR